MKAISSVIVASFFILALQGCGAAERMSARHGSHATDGGFELAGSSSGDCQSHSKKVFNDTSASLSQIGAALSGIAERDFGGYRALAIAQVGVASAEIAQAIAAIANECLLPAAQPGQAITDPVQLPAAPGKDGQLLYQQADAITAGVNALVVSITRRNFDGHRANAVAALNQALSDLQYAVNEEACFEGQPNGFCVAATSHSFSWRGNVVATRCGMVTDGFKTGFYPQLDQGADCFSSYVVKTSDYPKCVVDSFVWTDGNTYEEQCGCGQPAEPGFYRNGKNKDGLVCWDKLIFKKK